MVEAGASSVPAQSTVSAPNDAAHQNNQNNQQHQNQNNTSKTQKIEFNPRWKGYVYILLCSLVNFASVSNLELQNDPTLKGSWQASLMFGIVTFVAAVVILILDRFQSCCNNDTGDKFNFTKAMDGRFEGYTLVAFTLWWIIGVGQITQVGGVAYSANNIYFSAWLALVACIYTLDQWSSSKDIISIHELTGVSATLKSWYLLFLSSLVTMGTSSDMHSQIAATYKRDTAYGIVFGLFSTLASLFWILVNYRIIDFQYLQVGGWIELSSSFLLILIWVVGVSVLTQESGIAATIGGSGYTNHKSKKLNVNFGDGCYVVWRDETGNDTSNSPENSPTSAPSFKETIARPTQTTYTIIMSAPSLRPSSQPSLFSNETTNDNTVLTDTGPQIQENSTFSDDAIISSLTLGQNTTSANNTDTAQNKTSSRKMQEAAVDVPFSDPSSTSDKNVSGNASSASSDMPSYSPTMAPPSTFPTIPLSSMPSSAPSIGDNGVRCSTILDMQIPGSNLYFSVWLCFFAAFNVTLRWKAAQAMNFAKAQNRKAEETIEVDEADPNDSENDDVDVDEDDTL